MKLFLFFVTFHGTSTYLKVDRGVSTRPARGRLHAVVLRAPHRSGGNGHHRQAAEPQVRCRVRSSRGKQHRWVCERARRAQALGAAAVELPRATGEQ